MTGYVQSSLQRIQNQYLTYCGVNLQTDQVTLTAGTVTQAMQSYLRDLQAGGNYSTSVRMQQNMAIVTAWADAVTNSVNPLYNELQIFSTTLLGGLQPQSGPLATCANAVFSNWQLYAAQKSPVDDRQYFDLIYGWAFSLINLQAQAMQMIQAANQYKFVGRPSVYGSTMWDGGESTPGGLFDNIVVTFSDPACILFTIIATAHAPMQTEPPMRTSKQRQGIPTLSLGRCRLTSAFTP